MFAACHSTRCRAKESRDGEFRVACKGVKHREIRLYARQGLAGGSGGHSGTLNLIERARRFATPVPFQTMKRWKIVRAGGAPRMLAACPRRARIQGSQTFVSLNSRLESNKEERRRSTSYACSVSASAKRSGTRENTRAAHHQHQTPVSPAPHLQRLMHLLLLLNYSRA